MTDHNERNDTTRRTFLEATAGAVALGGVAGLVGAQQDGPQLIVLGGRTPGWRGRAPASIEGATNPELPFVTGQDYRVRWTNVDGQPHNFVVLDGGGNPLVSTDIISSQGAVQEVTFTASEEMTEYYCEVHPNSMRGNVRLVEEQQLEPVNESQLNQTDDAEPADNGTDPQPDNVSQPIGLTNETFAGRNETQLQQWQQSRQRTFNQTGNGTVRGNLTGATNETTNGTQPNMTGDASAGGVAAGDVRQVARAPGFGVLSALGGLVGGTALLSNRSDE
jgi:hypothetical protein